MRAWPRVPSIDFFLTRVDRLSYEFKKSGSIQLLFSLVLFLFSFKEKSRKTIQSGIISVFTKPHPQKRFVACSCESVLSYNFKLKKFPHFEVYTAIFTSYTLLNTFNQTIQLSSIDSCLEEFMERLSGRIWKLQIQSTNTSLYVLLTYINSSHAVELYVCVTAF